MRIAILLAIALSGSNAHAECRVPTWAGTSTQDAVPVHGSLYMYQSATRGAFPAPETAWVGPAGGANVVQVTDDVFRIDYDGLPATKLELRPPYGDPVAFELSTQWIAPTAPPRVLQYWHDVYEWTCSSSDALMIQLDQSTAAVRARWTFEGKTTELLVPARTDDGRSAIVLGKRNCAGENIPPELLRRGGHLELVAIRLDGTEVPVVGMPAIISTANMPETDDGLEHALILPPAPLAPVVRARPRDHASPIYGAAVLVVLALGLGIAWRTRVITPTQH